MQQPKTSPCLFATRSDKIYDNDQQYAAMPMVVAAVAG